MSGLVAVFRRDRRPVEVAEVERMLDAVPECSVDGQSAWVADEVGLGHQRFWVLPEEVGEVQPLRDVGSGCALIADLRLDNRIELLRELAAPGDEAASWSDARLLLAAYLRWGQACVDRLLGEFAFVLWDAPRKTMFAARDPMGARGLSYHLSDGVALLASNVEQVLAHGAVAARINDSRIVDLLESDWSDQVATFYRDVFDLAPGAALTVTSTRTEVREFCDLRPAKPLRYRDERSYGEHYRELVTEAVRCRLRSTGRIGLALSGGLDSTLLAAIAAPLVPRGSGGGSDLQCCSYVFARHSSCDERDFIEPLVAQLGVVSRYAWCDDLWTLRDADRWPVHRDYVLTDPYPWLPDAVNRLAQQGGCRVLLGGYYGDVLTAGSGDWAAGMAADGRLVELVRELWQHRSPAVWGGAARSLGRPAMPRWIGRTRRAWQRRRGPHPALSRRLAAASDRGESRRGFYRHLRLACFAQGPASVRRRYNAVGLEPLAPYEDRRLVELVLAIPADQLGRPGAGNDRRIHREAARGLLPEPIRSRIGRTSFFPLLREGLFEREAATVARLLTRPRIVEMGYIDAVWLATHPPSPDLPLADLEMLWLSLCLEMWLRKFW